MAASPSQQKVARTAWREATGQHCKTSPADAAEPAEPTQPERRAPWGPVLLILAVELCERLTYYTLQSSQDTYLFKQLGHSPSTAASMKTVCGMLGYMWCLPGGLIADAFGRFKVIIASASLYAVGTVVVAISVHCEHQVALKGLFLFGSSVLVPLGTGGIKPNICNFGADQIGDETETQRTAQKRFFTLFYMSINVGVVVAFGLLAYVTTQGLPSLGVHVEDGYFTAYTIAGVSMVVAVCLFVAGAKCYTVRPGDGIEGFSTMLGSVAYSVTHGGGWRAIACAVGWVCLPCFLAVTVAASMWPEDGGAAAPGSFPNEWEAACDPTGATRLLSQVGGLLADEAVTPAAAVRRLGGGGGAGVRAGLNHAALALGCVACVCLVVAHVNNQWIKPLPTRRATSFSVEEVRQGFATVPLVVVVNLFFAMGYNATNTAFPRQACQMNTLIGGAQLNGTQMNLGDAFAIIACSPLFEGVLFPLIRRLKGSPVRLGQKLVAGLLVAALGNAVAARLEVQRRQAPLLCGEAPSRCAPAGVHMRDISAFWMLVPYALIGAAEVLVNPCMFYFCYTAAPPKVRSLVQAFNLFFVGAVPSAFTSVAVAATLPDDLDSSRLEYYYILNVACALAGVLAYFLVTRCGSSGQDLKDGAEEDPGVAQERPADRAAELQEEAAPCRDDA